MKNSKLSKILIILDGDIEEIEGIAEVVINHFTIQSEVINIIDIMESIKIDTVDIFRRIAGCKYSDTKGTIRKEILPHEINIEKEYIAGKCRVSPGIYNAYLLTGLLRKIITEYVPHITYFPVIIGGRYIATHTEGGMHLRTVVLGYPVYISIPGIYEAPAKDLDFHVLRTIIATLGPGQYIPEIHLRTANYKSLIKRALNNIVTSFILQGIAYFYYDMIFCTNPHCALYDNHRLNQILKNTYPQLQLCTRHRMIFAKIIYNKVAIIE